jgi:choline dehydrogenase-like flavoprotein
MHDYLIVGAGSAGCALAARLTEDPDVSVMLLEAGPPDSEVALHIPVAFSQLYRTPFDWDYLSGPEPALGGRELYVPRGRVLGGSSSLNAMIYIRGNPLDYAAWGPGWGWDDVLPYFLRAEDNERGASPLHGAGGPLTVSDGRSRHPLATAWLEAAEDAGLEPNDDFNGPRQDGVGRYQLTQRGGMRCSAAVAYLHPALSRPNLTLIPGAPVTRLLFEGTRAVGVEALIEGVPQEVRAAREVVLCAGTYNTPQLLMLSGIGPAEHLVGHGLDVRLDQPAVGANLSDHINAGLIIRTDTETLMTAESAENVALLRTEGRGPLTSNIAEAGGFWRSRDGLDAPDIQFHMAPVMFAEEGLLPPTEHAWSAGACVLEPECRGEVRLRSPDPTAKPRIVTNWLDSERDWEAMLAAQRLLLEIAARPAMARHGTDPYQAPASDSEHDLRHHVREVAHCLYHPVGTCALGTVVDAELRVQGVDGLRVADASVIPAVPRGNTNAPTIMIGERAADLLLGTAPVSAADAKAAA